MIFVHQVSGLFLSDRQPSQRAESAILATIGQRWRGFSGGRHLAPVTPMAAPRTVWRIRLQDGSVVHGVLWERRPKTAVVWYRDDVVEGVEEFQDAGEAEDCAGALVTRIKFRIK